ncbi:MAG: restriction endonuclease subunit S [Saprospiraceae bacterium]|nr:restriction endonuclease subunit S [Saprospiraceae bacterium]
MKVLLKDVAEIRTGVFVKPNIKGEVVYLQLNDFDENGNHKGHWVSSVSENDVNSKHYLCPGDVLFAAKGSKNFASVRVSKLPLAVASTSFFVIRIQKDELLPEFLMWFLNQPETILLLQAEAKGTDIPSISKKSLEQISIPVIPVTKQKLILKIDQYRQKQKGYLAKNCTSER